MNEVMYMIPAVVDAVEVPDLPRFTTQAPAYPRHHHIPPTDSFDRILRACRFQLPVTTLPKTILCLPAAGYEFPEHVVGQSRT